MIRKSDARLQAVLGSDPGVLIVAQAEVRRKISQPDVVGDIEGVLVDVALPAENEWRSAASEVVRQQAWQQVRVGHESGSRAKARDDGRRGEHRSAAGAQAHGIESRIRDPQREILSQTSLLQLHPEFKIVP